MPADSHQLIVTALPSHGQIENAGSAQARLIPATLTGLGGAVEAARPTGPVLIIIGDVAARARAILCSETDVPRLCQALDSRRVAER